MRAKLTSAPATSKAGHLFGFRSDVPEVSPRVDRLLTTLSGVDRRLLGKRDLPFGSSVLVAAVKPA